MRTTKEKLKRKSSRYTGELAGRHCLKSEPTDSRKFIPLHLSQMTSKGGKMRDILSTVAQLQCLRDRSEKFCKQVSFPALRLENDRSLFVSYSRSVRAV